MNGGETSHPLSVTRQKKAEKVKYFLSPHNKIGDGARSSSDLLALAKVASAVFVHLSWLPGSLILMDYGSSLKLVETAQPRWALTGSMCLC